MASFPKLMSNNNKTFQVCRIMSISCSLSHLAFRHICPFCHHYLMCKCNVTIKYYILLSYEVFLYVTNNSFHLSMYHILNSKHVRQQKQSCTWSWRLHVRAARVGRNQTCRHLHSPSAPLLSNIIMTVIFSLLYFKISHSFVRGFKHFLKIICRQI